MNIHIVTIFPGMFDSYINESILSRGQEEGILSFSFHDPREKTEDAHKTMDDRPYGGGPGMVMKAEPILKTINEIIGSLEGDFEVILFSPSGEQFDNTLARKYAKETENLVLVCGRYEGIDSRVEQVLRDTYPEQTTTLSIGPYVLTGGELAALVLSDAVARHIPGVLGNESSPEEERTASSQMYTRPETFEWNGKEYSVPDVLLSGHHENIEKWREEN
ncbi:MAG: tRNA (guanosine(37)-N1)-methyltransferase TrmD [Candidatus Paceibacterota bacterium]